MGYVGGGFFPDADNSEFLINIETPPGSNLDYTKVKSEEAARLAREMPEVLYTYTTLGGYMLGRLGRRPQVGDVVEVGEHTLRVAAVDGLRVSRVRII